jgi:hypothetical protein
MFIFSKIGLLQKVQTRGAAVAAISVSNVETRRAERNLHQPPKERGKILVSAQYIRVFLRAGC